MKHRVKAGYVCIIIILSLVMQACVNSSVSEETEQSSHVTDVETADVSMSNNASAESTEGQGMSVADDNDKETVDTPAEDTPAVDAEQKQTLSGDGVAGVNRDDLKEKHVRITLQGSGTDIFRPLNDGQQDYRYSIAMMLEDDGGMDAWFASPGDGVNEYDWVTYRHSYDGGKTWSDERVVLSPSPCTPDSLSICDPDVFFYDGYYYIGYTSTINKNEKGLCNSVFLARSKDADGPYEKWNGSGWGGMPMPIVYYNGVEVGWGCGEPSFVVMDNVLYMYSSRDAFTPDLERLRVTEIRTADLNDPEWPSKLEYKGHTALIDEPGEKGVYSYEYADSWDVAYLEDSRKFIAVCANRRFEDDSCLLYFESNDGVNFERVSEINKNVITRCHNAGIMSDGSGHIKANDPVLLGYSYAGLDNSKWGIWSTRIVPAVIEYTDEIDRSDDFGENLKLPMQYKTTTEDEAPLMLRTDRLMYRCTPGDGVFNIRYYLRDNYRNERFVGSSGIVIENYDENIVSVNSRNEIVPKAEGMTLATVDYNGYRRDICLCVMPSEHYNSKTLLGFCSLDNKYNISLNDPFIVKIRPMAVFESWEMHELSNEEILKYGVIFVSSNEKVCEVETDGTVHPKAVGEAKIDIVSLDGISYEIWVKVSEDEE